MRIIRLLRHSALPAHRAETLKELFIKVLSEPRHIAAGNSHRMAGSPM